MSSPILIYKGPYTGPFVGKSLVAQLQNMVDPRFHKIVETSLFSEGWNDPKSIKAYVVPGGNAVRMMCEPHIKELGDNLKKYSISYLGVCAGGMLASKELYETLGPLRVGLVPSNMLNLVENNVIAPIFPILRGVNLTPADFRIINSSPNGLSGKKPIALAHILSPGYIPTSGVQDEEILANYSLPPSLQYDTNKSTPCHPLKDAPVVESLFIRRGSNQAKTLLTGAHVEVQSSHVRSDQFRTSFNATREEQEQFANLLQVDDIAREALFKSYLEKLDIRCRKE